MQDQGWLLQYTMKPIIKAKRPRLLRHLQRVWEDFYSLLLDDFLSPRLTLKSQDR